MPLSASTRLGPYEVVAPIGAGGMGEVYRARDSRLGRDVAIKVLPAEVAQDAERRARFEREARAVSSLNHPHICTLHDIGAIDTSHGLRVGTPKPLFQLPEGTGFGWDVSADGERFLLNVPVVKSSSVPLSVVVNWAAGLRK